MTVCRPGEPGRPALESLVRRAFADQHGAAIHSFMPNLLGLHGPRGQLHGVAGFRNAAVEPLFLENYLDAPIETVLSARIGTRVDRSEIVEVGNLAGASCRAACRLVAELPRFFVAHGQRWVVFTATDVVRDMLAKFGAPLIQLGIAELRRVAASGDEWGRYYNRDPRVMAGYLPDGLAMRLGRQAR